MSDTITEIKPGQLFWHKDAVWRVGDNMLTNVSTGEQAWECICVTETWRSDEEKRNFNVEQITEGMSKAGKIEAELDAEMKRGIYREVSSLQSGLELAVETVGYDGKDAHGEAGMNALIEQMIQSIEEDLVDVRRRVEYQFARRRNVTYGLPGDWKYAPDADGEH